MGQSRDTNKEFEFINRPSQSSRRVGIDAAEKAPDQQAAGQSTPPVGDDILKGLLKEQIKVEDKDENPITRFAGDILDPANIESIAFESSKTKYGPGQLSKASAQDTYLGQSSYPAR